MSFFYDLNKKLDSIRATPEVTHQQLNERDMKKNDKYATKKVSEEFGPGTAGPNKNLPGPEYSFSPDTKNYKTPHSDASVAASQNIDKTMGQGYSAKNYPTADIGAAARDGRGQTKYINRTAPGVINKIKDKLGLDMPDSAYGPRPDERERLAKRYPAPAKSVDEGGEIIDGVYKLAIEPKRPEELENKMTRGTRPRSDKSNQIFPSMRLPSDEKFPPMRLPKGDERVFPPMRLPSDEKFPPMRLPTDESGGPAPAKPKSMVDKQVSKMNTPPPTRPTRPNPAPKGEFMGTIKGGVWTADPPKRGEKGVPVPMDPEGVKEGGYYDPAHNQAANDLSNSMTKPANTEPPTGAYSKQEILKRAQEKANAANNPNGVKEAGTKPKNFADKIARAKKEIDEMLGDVAAEAMRTALSPKQKKMAALGGDPERIDGPDLAALRKGAKMGEDNAFDYKTPRSMNKGEKKTSSTGGEIYQKDNKTVVHTAGRHYGGGDEPNPNKEKRTKAGRPDGTGKKIGAKGPSGKSKLMTREGEVDIRDQGEYDQEGDMAKNDIKTIVRHAQALSRVLGDDDNLPEWVQSKLSKIEGMMISIDEYMQNQEDDGEEPIAEKAVSKKQQRFMGMVHSAQKGEKPASRAVGKVANTMKPKDTADFAKTKHKGLPEKKKKEVDENSEDGRLTVKQTGPGQTSTSSSTGRISATVDKGTVSVKPAKSGGMSYGKGIYDSINLELENMIAESMSINMSDSTDGNKSLTITATDEDAMKLAMMLKNAGLGGHGDDMHSSGEQACGTCGMPNCGCGDIDQAIDENAPDYPTNTLTSDNALQYAGGLNKPKTDVAGDGQTTIPNTAVHTQEEDALRRMMEMAGLAEAAKPDFLDINKNGDKEESMKDAAADVNEEEDTVKESIRRMREMAGIQEAKKDLADKDYDGDGNIESGKDEHAGSVDKAIKKAQAEKKVDESIFALTNQWQAYKG